MLKIFIYKIVTQLSHFILPKENVYSLALRLTKQKVP